MLEQGYSRARGFISRRDISRIFWGKNYECRLCLRQFRCLSPDAPNLLLAGTGNLHRRKNVTEQESVVESTIIVDKQMFQMH